MATRIRNPFAKAASLRACFERRGSVVEPPILQACRKPARSLREDIRRACVRDVGRDGGANRCCAPIIPCQWCKFAIYAHGADPGTLYYAGEVFRRQEA